MIIGTYNVPPFSMYEDGEQIGMITEVVMELLKQAEITDYKIINYPLMRGLIELEQGRIQIFYPYISATMPNIANNSLKILGPVSKYRLAIFTRSDNPSSVTFQSLSNAIVAAERGGLGHEFLTKANVKFELTTNKTSCLTMVIGKRVSYCAIGTLPGMYLAALNSMYSELRFVETEYYSDIDLLLGSELQLQQVAALETAYAKLKNEQYFDKKQSEYEAKFKIFIESMQ